MLPGRGACICKIPHSIVTKLVRTHSHPFPVSPTRDVGARQERHMPIWRFCNGSPRTQGGGGLSKSTLLIILGTLTRPQCAGITPDPVCIPTILRLRLKAKAEAQP